MNSSTLYRIPGCLLTLLLAGVLSAACGPNAGGKPGVDDSESLTFECATPYSDNAEASDEVADAFGIAEYRYELDIENNALRVALMDAARDELGHWQLSTRLDDGLTARTSITLEDAHGEPALRSDVTTRLIPGLGYQITGVRTLDGQALHIQMLLSGNPGVQQVRLAVPAAQVESPPADLSPQQLPLGEFYTLELYDVDSASFISKEAATQWSDALGVTELLNGSAVQRETALLNDASWRAQGLLHLEGCLGGEQDGTVRVQNLDSALNTQQSTHEQPLQTRAQPLSCAQEANIKDTQKSLSAALDAVADLSGAGILTGGGSGIGGISKAMGEIASTTGMGIDVGGGYSIPPGLLVAQVGRVGLSAATAAGAASPVGIALMGLGAGAYIAARVNDAFGDDIMRAIAGGSADDGGSGGAGSGTRSGGSTGDPHLRTLDGLAYDFQSSGEFVLVRAAGPDPLEIQVRQEPMTSICSGIAVNTAVAASVGAHRFAAYAETGTATLDGQTLSIREGSSLWLENGALISRLAEDRYALLWRDGTLLMVSRLSSDALNIKTYLSYDRRGQTQGLLGNFNGDPSDDLMTPDGLALEQPTPWLALYGVFADAWRVNSARSLFDYAPGSDGSDYITPNFPARPQTQVDLDPQLRTQAEQTCVDAGVEHPTLLENCVLDVACMGDDSIAQGHAELPDPVETIELLYPIFLDDWQQQGDPDAGNWQLSDDGATVTQSINGDPTFFVSPDEYINTTIRGTLQVNTNYDDDYIGFVFGYQAPLEQNGDSIETVKAFVVSWKKYEQGEFDTLAEEGVTLAHADGVFTDLGTRFWGQNDSPIYQVLGTHYGEGRGWREFTEYDFTLEYGEDRIRIWIDSELLFDVTSQEAGFAFEAGRFGFYNMSQEQVIYSNFSAQQF